MRGVLLAAGLSTVLLLPGSLAAQRGGRGTPIPAGESCPAGTTEIRPRSCMAPELPAPSILDYRPKSTLVVPAHMVRTAKYPVIDYHAHVRSLIGSSSGLAQLGASIDSLNVRLMVAADGISGEQLKQTMAAINADPKMKDRVRVFTGVSLSNVGPGWAQKAVAQLEADVAAGAVGIGEIGKGLGLSTRKADGSRLKIDDPDLDPIWEAAARLRIPVFIHTADPPQFFETLDFTNERWLEMALFGERRFPPERFPTFEQLMTERNNLFRKHPKTRFVAAHFGWHANDLGRAAKMLDEFPNVTIEAGAILYDLGRQPRTARAFFEKYADRIMFGKDSFQPEEYPYYWRVFETADEYFDYYRDYHAFWKMYGLALPDEVLKKVYYKTALRVFKGLPQTGWPQ
jgi:predicted TIM-barrel fold metal-dependent hydrolase